MSGKLRISALQVAALAAADSSEEPSGDGTASPSAKSTCTQYTKHDHFRIELKCWIPHPMVVDPEESVRSPEYLQGILPAWMPELTPLSVEYHSHYLGDDHAGYDGTYRVMAWIEFDWDGGFMTNVTGSEKSSDFGMTHRVWSSAVTLRLAPFGPARTIRSGVCVQEKQAKKRTSMVHSSRTFTIGIASANPLVMTIAPDIDSILEGVISFGAMVLSYRTDLFPSHGVRVVKNGEEILKEVVYDASQVDALGVEGAIGLAIRLNSFTNADKIVINNV